MTDLWHRMWDSRVARFISREALSYTLERSCATTSLFLGIVILIGQPISSGNPNVRGLHYMDEIFQWLPFASDYAWAALTILPGAFQIVMIASKNRGFFRTASAWTVATVFLAIAILLFAANPATTGTVMYLMPAIGEFACYVQLKHRRICDAR